MPGGARIVGGEAPGGGALLRGGGGCGGSGGLAQEPPLAASENRQRGEQDRRRHQDRGRSFRLSRSSVKTIASLLALLLMSGYAKQELAPPSRPRPKSALSFETKAPDDTPERQSLLDLSRGATVVSRTGESMLQFSALQAIDGDPGSWWAPPPRDLPQ